VTNREKRVRRASGYATSSKTIPARARSAPMGVRVLYGEISAGRGPKVTYLSPRRRIIEDSDWAEWLAMRRDNPPPEVTQHKPPNRKLVGRPAPNEVSPIP
jgi:hypothetical protein